MLYVSNNGETCRDTLCQHPECWQSNIRRVREAVRQRNGIKQDQECVNKQSGKKYVERKRKSLKEMECFSLPTLKIIDMTDDLDMTEHLHGITSNYKREHQVQVLDSQIDVEKGKCLRSSRARHSARPPCQSSFRTQVPRTTPISPSLPEKHSRDWIAKHVKYDVDCAEEKMTKINFHEIYDYDEVCQEWQDMFISTAYLVWCPSKKRKRTKEQRESSGVSDNRKGFKNLVEDALPLPPESDKKKYRTSSKVPTGGQPYSPCRTPVSRVYNDRPGDYLLDGQFIMTITKEDVPKSLITSKKIIIQKPNEARKDEQATVMKKSSSTKVLVDISATLVATTPAVAENNSHEVGNEVWIKDKSVVEPGRLLKREKLDKRKTRFFKATSDIEPRKMFPLPSIAIPWGVIPDRRPGHCRNSIPHSVDLDVMMEPVLYLPRTSSTVSGNRSRVCASTEGKGEPSKSVLKIGPSKESVEERYNLTSAYRFSPKKVGTPAPTPATPRTRDEQRRRLSSSGLVRTNTKESLSKTRLEQLFEAELDGTDYKQIPAVQSSKGQIDLVINDVAESNQDPVESIGNELSKMSLNQNNPNAQSGGLDKVPGSESAMSDRAVSPSSRTNIPSDIWAELRCGGGYDHRRITPRSNLDVRNSDRRGSLQRGFHSSLGLSIYSYTGESSWKPHPPRLPKSFTYMGMFKPTVLPKMPAALTVVPVPSVTRTSQLVESRDTKAISKGRSIRIPPTPRGSPVPNIEVATASSASLAPESSAEIFIKTEDGFDEQQSLKNLKQKVKKTNISHEVEQEPEYLISREIIQEIEELPLDSEDQAVGAMQLDVANVSNHVSSGSTITEETLQDLVNSDKYAIEDRLRVLETLTGETDEFTDAESEITCTEPVITCPSSPSSEITSIRGGLTDASPEEKRSKNKITCKRGEITCEKDETMCSEDEMSHLQIEITSTKDASTKDERTEDSSVIKDEVTCSTVGDTCAKDEITCETRENCITARDIRIATEEDENDTKSVSGVQNNEVIEQSLNNNSGLASPIEKSLEQKLSFKSSTRDVQGSHRSLLYPGEDVRSILTECNYLPKVPSNFELMPFNVESDLLLPIKIESDLLLLNDDSLMDLTMEDDLARAREESAVNDDEETIIDLTNFDDLARTGESETTNDAKTE